MISGGPWSSHPWESLAIIPWVLVPEFPSHVDMRPEAACNYRHPIQDRSMIFQ